MSLNNAISGPAFAVLNEILGTYRSDDGIARPSRYEVLLLPPTGVRNIKGQSSNMSTGVMRESQGDGTVRQTSIKCESIQFPGRNLDTAPDTNIYGPTREIADGFTYGDISAKFYCHNDMREKKFFETWQRLAFNPQTFAMNYYDDYTGTIQIYQLDQRNNRRYGCELIECFPKNIGDQALSGAQATSAQEVDVTFGYRYWKNLTDEADLPKPLLDRLQGVLADQVERKLLNRIPKVLSRL